MEDQDLLFDISLLDILSGKIAEAEGHVVEFEEALAGTTGLIKELAAAVSGVLDVDLGTDLLESSDEEFSAGDEMEDDFWDDEAGKKDSKLGISDQPINTIIRDRADNNATSADMKGETTEVTLIKKTFDDVNNSITRLNTQEEAQLIPVINELIVSIRNLTDSIYYSNAHVSESIPVADTTPANREQEKENVAATQPMGAWEKTKTERDVIGFAADLIGIGAFAAGALGVAFSEVIVPVLAVAGTVALIKNAYDLDQEKEKARRRVDPLTGKVTYISRAELDALDTRNQYISNSIGYPGHNGTPGITVTKIPDITLEPNITEEEKKWGKFNLHPELDKNKMPGSAINKFPDKHLFTHGGYEKHITIHIHDGLIHEFIVNSGSVKESVPDIKRIVEGAIMAALKDAEIQN